MKARWFNIAILAIILSLSAAPVYAQTVLTPVFWQGSTGIGGNDWFNPNNWNPVLVPGTSHAAGIDPATNRPTLIASGPAHVGALVVGVGASHGDLTVNGNGLLSFGELKSDYFITIAQDTGSSGQMHVTGPAARVDAEDLYVGEFGSGVLNIQGGAVVSVSQFLRVGNSQGGEGEIFLSGPDSQLTKQGFGDSVIGQRGTGKVTVTAGGLFLDDYATELGGEATGQGSVLITGAGSQWDGGGLQVGGSGNGSLTVADGGKVRLNAGLILGAAGVLNVGAPAGAPAVAPGQVEASIINGEGGAVHLNHDGFLHLEVLLRGDLVITQSGPGTTRLTATQSSATRIEANNGIFELSAPFDIPIHVSGGLVRTISPLLSVDSTMTLPAGEGRFSRIYLSGPVTGPGDLVAVNSAGTVRLVTSTKTYTGDTIIGRTGVIGATGTTAELSVNMSNVLPATTDVAFNAGDGGTGTLQLVDTHQTVKSLSLRSGAGAITGSAVLNVSGKPDKAFTAGEIRLEGGVTLNLAAGSNMAGTGPTTANSPTVFVGDGSQLTGSGIMSNFVIERGGTLAPGSGIGVAITDDQAYEAGSIIEFQIRDATGQAGLDWDACATVRGLLTFTGTPADPIILRLQSLDPISGLPGEIANFDPDSNFQWLLTGTLLPGDAIVGFDPAAFEIDSSQFDNAFDGRFFLSTAENGIYMNYAVPPTCNDPFADADADGDVDPDDFGGFQACYTGESGAGFNPDDCGCFDRDFDSDIDSMDLESFAACASRANVPAPITCDGSL